MNIPNNLQIVPLQVIPKGLDCPYDDLSELYKLGLLMEILCEKENGIGLSAVQVGVALRFYIINYKNIEKSDKDNYRFFVNCNYKQIGNEYFDSLEGCLSLRKQDGSFRYFLVSRFKKISVNGKELIFEEGNLSLKDISFECENLEAVVHQHESDHSLLITIDQIGKEMFLFSK